MFKLGFCFLIRYTSFINNFVNNLSVLCFRETDIMLSLFFFYRCLHSYVLCNTVVFLFVEDLCYSLSNR